MYVLFRCPLLFWYHHFVIIVVPALRCHVLLINKAVAKAWLVGKVTIILTMSVTAPPSEQQADVVPPSLPRSLAASGAALHVPVRVELINGAILFGRITEMDPETMNLKMDAFTRRYVARRVAPSSCEGAARKEEYEDDPVPLRCMSSAVIRGGCVRYIDFLVGESMDGRELNAILDAVQSPPL